MKSTWIRNAIVDKTKIIDINMKKEEKVCTQQDSNLRGQHPIRPERIALTARPYVRTIGLSSNTFI